LETTVLASLGCGGPSPAHAAAKISKVKNLALFLLLSVFSLSGLHLLSKSILSNRFVKLFTHSQLFNEMFIFSSSVAVAALLVTSFLHRC